MSSLIVDSVPRNELALVPMGIVVAQRRQELNETVFVWTYKKSGRLGRLVSFCEAVVNGQAGIEISTIDSLDDGGKGARIHRFVLADLDENGNLSKLPSGNWILTLKT